MKTPPVRIVSKIVDIINRSSDIRRYCRVVCSPPNTVSSQLTVFTGNSGWQRSKNRHLRERHQAVLGDFQLAGGEVNMPQSI